MPVLTMPILTNTQRVARAQAFDDARNRTRPSRSKPEHEKKPRRKLMRVSGRWFIA